MNEHEFSTPTVALNRNGVKTIVNRSDYEANKEGDRADEFQLWTDADDKPSNDDADDKPSNDDADDDSKAAGKGKGKAGKAKPSEDQPTRRQGDNGLWYAYDAEGKQISEGYASEALLIGAMLPTS